LKATAVLPLDDCARQGLARDIATKSTAPLILLPPKNRIAISIDMLYSFAICDNTATSHNSNVGS
jgi:hypothetical protein